jgi:4-amino-4-deoxy-L-arabinose transferase-like glycosyltransferase
LCCFFRAAAHLHCVLRHTVRCAAGLRSFISGGRALFMKAGTHFTMNYGNRIHSNNDAGGSKLPWWRSRVLLALIAVGLTARVAVAIHAGLATPPVPGSDGSEYDSYAWNLAQGRGLSGISPDVTKPDGQLLEHPTAYRAPATSVLWAGLFKIFGHRYSVVRISHCVLGALTILLIYEIGRKCFGDTVALLAAAIYTVWPTALLYSSEFESEPLYTFLFCGFILAALQFAERATWPRSIAAGVLLGLAMLTRGNAVLMLALTVPWSIWQFRRTPRHIIRGLAIPFVAFAMLVPWTVRNYETFHAFIPFETGGGDVLLGSYNRIIASDPLYYGYWIYPTSELPEYRAQITAPNNELIRDHVETQLALQWARNHPETWWYLAESRFRRSWTPVLSQRSPMLYRVAMLASWGPILVFFALGFFPTLIYFLRTNNPGWILHLGVFHFVLTALIFWGASRFRYPIEGLCIILASSTFVWLWKYVAKRLRATPMQTDRLGTS